MKHIQLVKYKTVAKATDFYYVAFMIYCDM